VNRVRSLSDTALRRLVQALATDGVRVIGPVSRAGRTEYRRVADAGDLDLRGAMPAFSLKALFLPPTEPILSWRRHRGDVSISAPEPTAVPTVVIGARPCDAAGAAVLDKVMGWDYRDDAWFARRDATTIVAVACASPGPDCFCEKVGLGPAGTKGVDVLLTADDGGFQAEACSDKGLALFERAGEVFAPARQEPGPARAGEAGQDVRSHCEAAFDDPLWDRIALRCHGCGACAAVCPTCHCFDIVDEPDGLLAGTRRRNWDTCQSSIFTVHASGHNPRADQRARFRQRVMHKFSIYPRRFGEVLCTGCGRCSAACPAGQNMAEILAQVAAR
jgi:ferredoxin